MPLRLAIEAANRFIAAVAGGPHRRFRPPRASPSATVSPATEPFPSLSMMRRAASHTASIAPIISCLPSTTSSSRHSSSAVTPDPPTPIGAFKNPEQRKPPLGRDDVLSLRFQESLIPQSGDDLRPGRRRADALGLLETVPQDLIFDEAPRILHRLDQRALLVARRRPGFLVLDLRIAQPRDLPVAQHRQHLRPFALLLGGPPLGEGVAPATLDRLASGRAELESADIQRHDRLTVAVSLA